MLEWWNSQALSASASGWLTILIDTAVKGSLLLIAAGVAAWLLRRSSAAVRHLIWSSAVAALLIMPALSMTLPGWRILPTWTKPDFTRNVSDTTDTTGQPTAIGIAPVEPALEFDHDAATEPFPGASGIAKDGASAAVVEPSGDNWTPAAPSQETSTAAPWLPPAQKPANDPKANKPVGRPNWILLIWSMGTLLAVAPFLVGLASLWRLGRRAKRINDPAWTGLLRDLARQLGVRRKVVLLTSPGRPMPMTWGIFRPRLLLPASATAWSIDRKRTVILHELAHIKRHDCLTQYLLQFARAMHWFNPLIWLAGHRMVIERERACDDLVLAAGHKASDYAEALLQIASGLQSHTLSSYTAIAMARKSKLQGRLLAILDQTRNRRGLTRTGLIVAAILLVAVTLPLAIVHTGVGGPKFYVTGDPFPLELLGVQVDGAEAMYTPDGSLMPAPLTPLQTNLTWDDDEMQRDFVFKVPAVKEPTFFDRFLRFQVSGKERAISSYQNGIITAGNQPRTVTVTTRLDRNYLVGGFWAGVDKPIEFIDLTVMFYKGPPRSPSMTFAGPFKFRQSVKEANGAPATLTVDSLAGFSDRIEFRFVTSSRVPDGSRAFAFDKTGRRHRVHISGGLSSSSRDPVTLYTETVSPSEIAFITIGETPRQRTFHNVKVGYPDSPPVGYTAVLDQIAARLQIPQLRIPEFVKNGPQTPKEALAVIDLLRGPLLYRAVNTIQNGEPRLLASDLTAVEAQRLRQAANNWLKEDSVRSQAALIGLWAKWPAFVDPALDALEAHADQDGEIAYLFRNRRDMLTPAHKQRLGRIIEKYDDRSGFDSLFIALSWYPESQADVDVYATLAQSQRIEVWWSSLKRLANSPMGRSALRALVVEDNTMRRRVIQVAGRDMFEDLSDDEYHAAVNKLPELLTLNVLRLSPSTIREVYENIEKWCDPDLASPGLVAFIEKVLNRPNAAASGGFASPNEYAVVRAARILNRWHDINIGYVGTKEESTSMSVHWPAVARAALRWGRTGQDPSDLPVGWKPATRDLRLIMQSLEDPELSVIGVVEFSSTDGEKSPRLTLKLLQDFASCDVDFLSSPAPTYEIQVAHGMVASNRSKIKVTIADTQLPHKLVTNRPTRPRHQEGQWVLWVEPFADHKSVIDQTDLFAKWYENYLGKTPLQQPLSRVYAIHDRSAMANLLLTRHAAEPRLPADGWTDWQLALRDAMDQDPHYWPKFWDQYMDPPDIKQTIDAWHEVLQRNDLPKRVRAIINGRLANKCIDRYASNGRDSTLRVQACEYYEKVWQLEPEAVSILTINARTSVAQMVSAQTAEGISRRAETYRWYMTRTPNIVTQDRDLPTDFARNRLPYTTFTFSPNQLPSLKRNWLKSFESYKETFVGNLNRSLETLSKREPQRLRDFIEQVRDVAPPEQLERWQAMLGDEEETSHNISPSGTNVTSHRSSGSAKKRDDSTLEDKSPAVPALINVIDQAESKSKGDGSVQSETVVSSTALAVEATERAKTDAEPSSESPKASVTAVGADQPVIEVRPARLQAFEGGLALTPPGEDVVVYVASEQLLTDKDFTAAQVTKDSNGNPAVTLTLTHEAGERLHAHTSEHIREPLVIFIEGELLVAPRINSAMRDTVMITGGRDGLTQEQVATILGSIDGEAVSPRVEFSPLIERKVNFTDKDCLLDLDSGEFIDLPAEVAAQGSPDATKWIAEQGVDVGGGSQPAIRGLIGFDLVVSPMVNEKFDAVVALKLAKSLQEVFALSKPGNPVYLTARGGEPATYGFKTREGNVGLLQIVTVAENESTKIRYKLIRPRTDTPGTDATKKVPAAEVDALFAMDALDASQTNLVIQLLDAEGRPVEKSSVTLLPVTVGYRNMRAMNFLQIDKAGQVRIEGIEPGIHWYVANIEWPRPTLFKIDVPAEGGLVERRIDRRDIDRPDPDLSVKLERQDKADDIELVFTITNHSDKPYTLTEWDLSLVSPWATEVFPPASERAVGQIVPPRGQGKLTLRRSWNAYVHRGIWSTKSNFDISWPGPLEPTESGEHWFRARVARSQSIQIPLPIAVSPPEA